MASFFVAEREQGGWRFLLLWVIATSFGFFTGLSVEVVFTNSPNFFVAMPLAALGQAYVINRHISIYLPWAIGTTIFWVIGLAISIRVLNMMLVPDTFVLRLVYLGLVSFFAGLLAGIPQWVFMRDWLERIGIWWLIINAVSAALFFLPGLFNGIVLMRLITEDKISMIDRHYKLSGDF